MRRLIYTCLTVLSIAGCTAAGPVLRGSELVFRVRRVADSIPSLPRDRVFLEVELAPGQEAGDIHAEGWYVSSAQMSRIFAILNGPNDSGGTESGDTRPLEHVVFE